LFVRGTLQDMKKNKSSGWGSKSRGRYNSAGKYLRKCWKCGKFGNYEKYYRSKKVYKENGSDDASSIEAKTSTEGDDVYLTSIGTHVYSSVWLIKWGASFCTNPNREWSMNMKNMMVLMSS